MNRDIKAMGECLAPEGERPEPADVAALVEELRDGEARNRVIEAESGERRRVAGEIAKTRRENEELRARAIKLRADAKWAEKVAAKGDADADERAKDLDARPALEDPFDSTETQSSIANAESRNAAVREYDVAAKQATKRAERQEDADTLSARLDAIKTDRAERIAAVDMPLDGLAIEDGAVLFEGVPASQASTTRRIEIGARIGLAKKPRLRVLRVEHGSLFDARMFERMRVITEEFDVQWWVERVADEDDGTGFFIEEGVLAERGSANQRELL